MDPGRPTPLLSPLLLLQVQQPVRLPGLRSRNHVSSLHFQFAD